MIIGFSTGALAGADFRAALRMLDGRGTTAVELSALRSSEFEPLLQSLGDLALNDFQYVSLHAPSDFVEVAEKTVAERIASDVPPDWNIIAHPDALKDLDAWRALNERLCIENMDKSKATGRTARELRSFFEALPESRLCLDVAHIRQVDPTMSQAVEMLQQFGSRVAQIHISDIDGRGTHLPLTTAAIFAYQEIVSLLPAGLPVIVESVIDPAQIEDELAKAIEAMSASSEAVA